MGILEPMVDQYHITQSKKEELEAELNHLKTVERVAISERVQTARAHGDLKENTEYEQARTDQGANESRIQEVEYILKHAHIIERTLSGLAELGGVVEVLKEGAEDKKIFTLVSAAEADMAKGRLSIESPIGKALIGKAKGDVVSVVTPAGETRYTIVSIS